MLNYYPTVDWRLLKECPPAKEGRYFVFPNTSGVVGVAYVWISKDGEVSWSDVEDPGERWDILYWAEFDVEKPQEFSDD